MLLAFEYMGSGTGRRGRKSYAEDAKGRPKNAINYLIYEFLFLVQIFLNSFQFWLCFSPRFLLHPRLLSLQVNKQHNCPKTSS
jgi:quinol-cytochrome oxidoreductase complex cytochrome b subunit